MKMSKDILLSTAARSVEEAEGDIEAVRVLLAQLQHEYPRLAPLHMGLLRALTKLSDANSRILDLLRGEHS